MDTRGERSELCQFSPRLAPSTEFIAPAPRFYVLRWQRGAPLVSAPIYQYCSMVIPQPTTVDEPNPEEWCRPFDRSPRFGALIDGNPVAVTGLDFAFATAGHARGIRLLHRLVGVAGRGAIPGCSKPGWEKPVNLALLPSPF